MVNWYEEEQNNLDLSRFGLIQSVLGQFPLLVSQTRLHNNPNAPDYREAICECLSVFLMVFKRLRLPQRNSPSFAMIWLQPDDLDLLQAFYHSPLPQ